jgi:hypothetical protein
VRVDRALARYVDHAIPSVNSRRAAARIRCSERRCDARTQSR